MRASIAEGNRNIEAEISSRKGTREWALELDGIHRDTKPSMIFTSITFQDEALDTHNV